MDEPDNYSKLLARLRGYLTQLKSGEKIYDEIVAPREGVLSHYGKIFSLEHIPHLQKDEFTPFLYFENNRHWSGLYRKGLGAASDMERLRSGLNLLLDESKPLSKRFPGALKMVSGMGKAIATAILTVAYPSKYGVWNNTSEGVLRQAGAWPSIEKGEGEGRQYELVNELLNRLADDLNVDLWTLDALWWYTAQDVEPDQTIDELTVPFAQFQLESQLEKFLIDNWEHTSLANEWEIFSTTEDLLVGNQYPTDVGFIDILAKHKTESRFLVIELKRNQSSDQTVGQALRYVGWIAKHLATNGETVEALLIARQFDKKTLYAISTLPKFRLMTYQVEFHLNPVSELPPQ